jgi:hypothetical protein
MTIGLNPPEGYVEEFGYPDAPELDQVELVEAREIDGAAEWLITSDVLDGLPPARTKITSAFTDILESNVPSERTLTDPLEAESESGCGTTDCEMDPPLLFKVTQTSAV